ncbi:MAG: hypothetical protein OXE86_18810 [Alphaproteobacteria bacterium]|nr:hypothetical protein [Alphaproteobacteria bacterium]
MAWQGSLDGLCGPYAIVNAYHLCGIEEDWLGQDIFNIACLAIKDWPQPLWNGTTFKQMRTMLKASQKALGKSYRKAGQEYPIEIEYTFHGNPPSTGKKFRKRLHEVFARDDVICGIIRMVEPAAHWFSFVKHREALVVFDSAPPGRMRRIELHDLHVREGGKKELVLIPGELIVFREK